MDKATLIESDQGSISSFWKHRQGPGLSPTLVRADSNLEARVWGMKPVRIRLRRKEVLFRTGERRPSANSLYFVHAGCFKTSILSEDGREKITGFPMRGDMLGQDSVGMKHYCCDVVALDVGEVWWVSGDTVEEYTGEYHARLSAILAAEIRRGSSWMLTLSTLSAQQRVVAFLLDLSERMKALGFSSQRITLPMTRAELGNFLALQLETVTRVLSQLQVLDLISVERRQVDIKQLPALRALLSATRRPH